METGDCVYRGKTKQQQNMEALDKNVHMLSDCAELTDKLNALSKLLLHVLISIL